jgi:acyl-CoA thioester hydrolase
MTHIYRRRFRVRGYEMDALSRVHDSVFLKYVQQAAFEASADAGYDTRRYNALGTIWVIRQQTIAYLAPLTYGDVVEASTWVSDMRRVRSHREYELRRVSDRCLTAVAQADWVYIDATTLFPRRIPQQAVEVFEPNSRIALDQVPPLEAVEPVRGRAFVYTHRVAGYELDNLRHVNNANYVNWLNQARVDALSEVGFSLDASSAKLCNLGVMLSPVRYEIEYFAPVMAGDWVEVHSRVEARGPTQLTWDHQIRRRDERLVTAKATVCFERDIGTAVPLPADVLTALSN